MGVNDLSDEDFISLYGAWTPRTPADVAGLLEGFPGLWWIAGGWALEAFTGVPRPHDDIDPSVLRDDLPALRRHLAGRLDVWAAAAGSLTPLLPDDRPEAGADAVLPAGCGQVWTRASAREEWEYDILLAPGTREEWVYRRDPSIRRPMERALWSDGAGVRYLQPEIQLLYKAKGLREKDHRDFEVTLPHLDDGRRAWLRDALHSTLPGHPWVGALADRSPGQR